jgi:hypothetical protein
MSRENEIYIYIGSVSSTHFFLHIVGSESFRFGISHNIMDVLIDDMAITNTDDVIVVYEVGRSGNMYCVCIRHNERGNDVDTNLEKNELENILVELMGHEKDKMYVILYNYDTCTYTPCKSDDGIKPLQLEDRREVRYVSYVETSKSIQTRRRSQSCI